MERETLNKSAEVFSVTAAGRNGFVWRWRSADGKQQSAGTFEYFHDCVADARTRGYDVPLDGRDAKNVDGTAR